MGVLERSFRLGFYYLVLRWLPASWQPGGRLARWSRLRVAGPLLDAVHETANIERGAYIGTGRGISVGARSGIGQNCRIHGPVAIGNDVMMGPDVVLLAHGHEHGRTDIPMIDQGSSDRKITIGDDVWIGTRCILLSGTTIGSSSIIGAGAVVARSVPPNSVVVSARPRILPRERATPASNDSEAGL
jgi:maltose O-acetyltransferase